MSTVNLAASTCDNTGPNTDANGKCTIVFSSPTAGKVTGHAFSTLLVGGVSTTISTPVDAVKTYVDANIQIHPERHQHVGTTHTFTAHVNVNKGDGAGFVNAPAGTVITFTKDSGPGSSRLRPRVPLPRHRQVHGHDHSGVAGSRSCSAASRPRSAASASPVTRAHDAERPAGPGGSGPATKVWVAARISIAPNATNEIGQPHTFTVTLEKDSGTGFGPAANEHVAVTLTPSGGATHSSAATGTCTNSGPNTKRRSVHGDVHVDMAGKVTGTRRRRCRSAGSAASRCRPTDRAELG